VELRPAHLPPDPASQTGSVAGETGQCDLWFPQIHLPVGSDRPIARHICRCSFSPLMVGGDPERCSQSDRVGPPRGRRLARRLRRLPAVARRWRSLPPGSPPGGSHSLCSDRVEEHIGSLWSLTDQSLDAVARPPDPRRSAIRRTWRSRRDRRCGGPEASCCPRGRHVRRSPSGLCELLARHRDEGESALGPRYQRPKRTPNPIRLLGGEWASPKSARRELRHGYTEAYSSGHGGQ